MRFLRVVLSVALLMSSLPLPVAAEDVISGDAEQSIVDAVEVKNSSNQETPKEQEEIPSEVATVESEELMPQSTPTQQVLQVLVMNTEEKVARKAPTITEVQMSGKCNLAKCTSTNSAEFIELYNPYDEELTLVGYSLVFVNKGGTKTTLTAFTAAQVIAPHQFVIITHDIDQTTYTSEAGIMVAVKPLATFTTSLVDGDGAVILQDNTDPVNPVVLDQVAWGATTTGYYTKPATVPSSPIDKPLQRCFVDGLLQIVDPRDTSREFVVYGNELATPGRGMACPVAAQAKPVNTCEGLRINEIAANSTKQFIELQNDTDHDVSIEGCQLQTNRSTVKSYIFGAEIVPAGAYKTIYISETELTLTKTTSGIVYLLSSDGQNETDRQAYSNLVSETSWSRTDEGSWLQTYVLTPNTPNVIQKYLPCDDGYERNETTGRCNKITSPSLVPNCGEGKYRNEETGRCRTIPAASVLAACKLGQYRSEETNRCRNIVAASIQKPCKDNQYRSEETNRCRNLTATNVPESAFAVQPVKDSAMAFVGWWALGGVGALAAGYGVWEWRREIAAGFSGIASRISGSR